MDNVSILPYENLGRNFISNGDIPAGSNEYYLRNTQTFWKDNKWRQLKPEEIKILVNNNNTSENWDKILVADEFEPELLNNNRFFGLVRIGRLNKVLLEHQGLQLPAGITNSIIIDCDLGDNIAIHNVRYMAHFIIADSCILFNIDEMITTNHAKFGNGIIKQGEQEEERIWLELMNEAGGRKVIPFDGMTTADAYLWAKYKDDIKLQEKLKEITQNTIDSNLGFYGMVGRQSVIKNSRILKDVKIGSHCCISGTNKLENLTINSSEEEPTHIGEGVELVSGIIGYGCNIIYGCKAVRFILGDNSNLKYGARIFDTYLGDNSTISCCEVLNNLIFPAHEQHHNNSFLIATLLMGQSNVAAGATIGSNHNSRANDNEILAGRGFWPGLCASLKHSSRFASFVLLAKADYPAELDIPLPFSLLNNNYAKDQLEVLPAYWWLYNMYALVRNSWKYINRDKRKRKTQHIEFDSLAPDSIEEIIHACRLLEIWTAKAYLQNNGQPFQLVNENELAAIGREQLHGSQEQIKGLEILGEDMEKSNRKVVILKVYNAYHAYLDMLYYYAVKNLVSYMNSDPQNSFTSMQDVLSGTRKGIWINFGGQLIPEENADKIRYEIVSGKLRSWEEIHNEYDSLWEEYQFEKQKHAYSILCEIYGINKITREQFIESLNKAITIQEFIRDQVYISRKKDYDDKFHKITFRNSDEMNAVIGKVDDNSFIKEVQNETEEFRKMVFKIKDRV